MSPVHSLQYSKEHPNGPAGKANESSLRPCILFLWGLLQCSPLHKPRDPKWFIPFQSPKLKYCVHFCSKRALCLAHKIPLDFTTLILVITCRIQITPFSDFLVCYGLIYRSSFFIPGKSWTYCAIFTDNPCLWASLTRLSLQRSVKENVHRAWRGSALPSSVFH